MSRLTWTQLEDAVWDGLSPLFNGLTPTVPDSNIVWDDQNSPQPSRPYVTLSLSSYDEVTETWTGKADASGNVNLRYDAEFVVMIQYFGEGAFGKLRDVVHELKKPSVKESLNTLELALVDILSINDTSALEDSRISIRASLDLLFRIGEEDSIVKGFIEKMKAVRTYLGAGGVTILSGFKAFRGEIAINYELQWGSLGVGDGQFNTPLGLCSDDNSNIYIVDYGNDRIQKFDEDGSFLIEWGSPGVGNGQFNDPSYISFINNNIYVTDSGNNRVQVFDTDGTYLFQFGTYGTGDGQFDFPSGIVSDGVYLYIVDAFNDRIQKFDEDGTFVAKWGSTGTGDGEFSFPFGINVDSNGHLYVADTFNSRVQKFDNTGVFILQWGSLGVGNRQFNLSYDLAIDSRENIYTVDYINNRIQVFYIYGDFTTKQGSTGTGDGEYSFLANICVAPNGSIYVSDTGNNRIQRLSLDLEL